MSDLVALFYIFGFIIAVLWFFMPFAVFGIKDRLDQLITLQKQTNKLLQQSGLPDTDKNND